MNTKLLKKKEKVESVRKETDEAVIQFQRHLAGKEEEISQLKQQMIDIKASMKDLQRVSMVTTGMGPVTERDQNEFEQTDKLGVKVLPQTKAQNAVLQQKLNENDLDKLAEKNLQRRDSQKSKGFLALTRFIRSSGSGTGSYLKPEDQTAPNFDLSDDFGIASNNITDHTQQAQLTH